MSHLPFLGSLELCLAHREQRGLEALVEKKGREQIPKTTCVYLKSWCGERASGTEQGQGNNSLLHQTQAGISLSLASGCAAYSVAITVAFCAARA